MPIKILVLNGPNLNMIRDRDPELYGHTSIEKIAEELRKSPEGSHCEIIDRQSNHEGDLIDWIQQAHAEGFRGIIINPGGLTHTSVSLRDALVIAKKLGVPTYEVHLSDISTREEFRRFSFLSSPPHPAVVIGTVCGQKELGYGIALRLLLRHITSVPLKKE